LGLKRGGVEFLNIFFGSSNLDPSLSLLEFTPGKRRIAEPCTAVDLGLEWTVVNCRMKGVGVEHEMDNGLEWTRMARVGQEWTGVVLSGPWKVDWSGPEY